MNDTSIHFILEGLFYRLLVIAAALILLRYVVRVAYHVFISPLKSIPGPFMARFTRLWEVWAMSRGGFHKRVVELHEKHGNHYAQSHHAGTSLLTRI